MVSQVGLVNFLAEILLQGQVVALTVDLMAIGLEIAKLVTGRTNAIVVVKEVI